MSRILDGFDELSDRIEEERGASLRATQLSTGPLAPEQAARANALADDLGQPFGVVAANLDAYDEDERLARVSTVGQRSPAVGDFLSDPRRMALAGDEPEALETFATAMGDFAFAPTAAPAPAGGPQMQATRPNYLQELIGALVAGQRRGVSYLGEVLPDLRSGRSRATEEAVARGLGYASGADAAAARTGAYLADVERQAQGAEVMSEATRQDFGQLAQANDASSLLEAAGLVLRAPRALGTTVAGSLGMGAPTLALTAATGGMGRLATAGTAGTGSGLTEYGASLSQSMADAGVDTTDPYAVASFLRDPEKVAAARERATKRGVAIGAFDALTAGLAGLFVNNARRGITSAAWRTAAEGAVQAGGGMAGETAAQLATGDELQLGDILVEGVAEVPTGAVEVWSNYRTARDAGRVRWINERMDQVLRATDEAGRLQAATDAAAAMKLGERSPNDVAAFVGQLGAEDARVYLPADAARTLFQSERELVELVGSADELAEQLASGELAIPMPQWMAVVPRLANKDEVLRHARTSPDGLSPAELEALDVEGMASELGATDEAAERAQPGAEDPRQRVIDDVMGQLVSTDRYTPAAAEAQARLWGAAFAQFGRMTGQDPFALYERYMGGVRGPADPRARRPFTGSGRTDALIDSIRTPDATPSREVFGPSLTSWLRDQGGVVDAGGELRGMDAGRLRPGLVSMMGLDLDRARELAAEAGYLPADSTPADLLDLIDRDLREGDVFSPGMGDAARQEFEGERQALLDAIAATPALRDMAPEEFAALTNQQIVDMLTPEESLDQPAFHGTPHTVDRFSLHRIGSGTGDNNFGYGLYFASQQDVADFYRRNSVGIARNIPASMGDQALRDAGGDRGRAVAALTRKRDALPEAARGNTQAAIDWLRRGQSTGALYQVDIPDNSDLLAWDLPMSEQPPKVREAMEAILASDAMDPTTRAEWDAKPDARKDGANFYTILASSFNMPEKAKSASELLLQHGVPGLRYNDGDSRPGGTDTHNYVIWDEAAISEPTRLYQSANPAASFAGMTREQFLGDPKITSNANAADLEPRAYQFLDEVRAEPFAAGEGLTAKYAPDGAAVFDGDAVVASYNNGDTLVVAKKYRRHGIGEELAYQWRVRNPGAKPAATRTKASQALQEKVWSRIEREREAQPVDQTQTAAFRRWFGDSKVVDANGDPLVVYHGTGGNFDVFMDRPGRGAGGHSARQGFFFSNSPDTASGYATETVEFQRTRGYERAMRLELRGDYDEAQALNQELESPDYSGGMTPNVMPVYLKMDNPATYDFEGRSYDAGRDNLTEFIQKAKRDGHDGVIFRNFDDAVRGNEVADQYVVFRPEQIKSATANSGAFDPNNPSILAQMGDQAPRGQIDIYPDRRMAISLFKGADRSTFLHETGHFFLELFRDIAAQENAPQQVKDDMAALLAWFGVESPEQIGVDQHEQWARGFEQYLAEGKAPTPELQTVFAQFKAWLLSIYRNLRALNVDLTDDVRGVMDRMLASEEEVDAARARAGDVPLARTPEEAQQLGLSPAQFADYQAMVAAAAEEAKAEVLAQLVKAQDRATRAWWKEERANVFGEVLAEVEAIPVFRAARVLSGAQTFYDGTPIPEEMRIKLDKASLVAMYGTEYLRRLRGMYAVNGGLSQDDAAMILGFASGDDLVKSLANRGDLRARAEAEADARMLARHGDPFTDGRVAELAMDAVHGRRRVQLLERELAMLATLAGEPAPSRRALSAVAAELVARKTPRQLRPNEYLVAERKAAREATVAAARGDYAAALAAKRRQAFNAAMFGQAREAQQEFDKHARYLRRMSEGAARSRLGKAGAGYLDQVDALLEQLEIRPASGAEVRRRARLSDWVAQQELAGNPVNVPQRLLDEAGLTNIRDMPLADLRGVVDTIKQIDHLAKTKNKLLLAGQERDREAVDAEMAGSVLGAYEVQPQRTGDETRGEVVARKTQELDIQRLLPTNIARELDGYEDGGAVWRNVILPIREAMYSKVMPETKAMQTTLADAMRQHYTEAELRDLDTPIWRDAVADMWSRGRILSLAMNWGSEGNREAILGQASHKLTPEQVGILLSQLDARDFRFVQQVVDQVNSYWPAIAEAQRRRTGLVPEKVGAAPYAVTTADGETIEVAGGYFPLKYDAERSGYGATLQEMDDVYNDLRVGKTARAATRNGHTKERVGSGGKTVKLGLDVASGHMRDVIRDLHLGDAVTYVHQVLHGPQFTAAVTSTGRREYLKALDVWLKDVAAGEVGARSATEAVVAFIRRNLTAAVLTYKAGSALLQVTGLFQTGAVLGRRQTVKGLGQLLSKSWLGPHSIWQDIRAQSPFMAERLGQVPDSVQKVAGARAGKLSNAWATMVRWGYVPMGRLQMIADGATWLAARDKALRENGGDQAEAVAFADDAVNRLQAPADFIDKAAVSRGTLNENTRQSEPVKATAMLLTYMIAKGNVQRELFQRAGGNTGSFTRNVRGIVTSPREAMGFAVAMVQLFVLETLFMDLLRNGLPEDDDDDGWVLDDWLAYMATEIGLGTASTIPLVSQLATAGRGYDAQGPLERAWSGAAKSVKTLSANLTEDDEEWGREDLRAIVTLGGIGLAIPSSSINTTADALWRVYDGEDVSPVDFVVRPEKPRE